MVAEGPTAAVLVALTLLAPLAGCGADGSETTETTRVPATAASDGVGPDGVVEVPPSPPLGEFDPYVEGTPVEIGQVADMGAVLVIVDGFTPGPPTGTGATTADVAMVVDNVDDAPVVLPDVYTVCATDGRRGTATTEGDLEILAPLAGGEAVEGSMNVEVVDGCPDLLLQVLSQNETAATPPVAQYEVPAEVAGG